MGFLAAWLSGSLQPDAPAPPHLVIGAAAALHLATILDATVFGFETVREPVKGAAPRPWRPVVAPLFVPAPGGGIAALAGSF